MIHSLTPLQALGIFAAGIVAGTINTVVGSGTLFTFPVLLQFGYSPVVANVSNTVGLVPGSASGAFGYRDELRGQRARMLRLSAASVTGGIAGAVLLLVLPASAFKAIVPGFIAIALVLIVLQPRLSAALAARGVHKRELAGPAATAAVFAAGIYGGYFGAAQGIMLLSILALSLNDDLQRINALKVVLAGLVNLVAGIVFVIALVAVMLEMIDAESHRPGREIRQIGQNCHQDVPRFARQNQIMGSVVNYHVICVIRKSAHTIGHQKA